MPILKVIAACLLSLALFLVLFQARLFGVTASAQNVATLSAPLEVTASDNAYSNKVSISWSAVRGATQYRVLRNTINEPATAISIATTAAGSFLDTRGVAGQTYFYWVRAENGSVLGSLSDPDQGTRAVGTINGPVGPLNPPPAPPGNEITAAKAYLGKSLFWDEQLSSTRTVACGTCHFATTGGS